MPSQKIAVVAYSNARKGWVAMLLLSVANCEKGSFLTANGFNGSMLIDAHPFETNSLCAEAVLHNLGRDCDYKDIRYPNKVIEDLFH